MRIDASIYGVVVCHTLIRKAPIPYNAKNIIAAFKTNAKFLWDSDFGNDNLLDKSPEAARIIGSLMGVDQECHTTIPPDLVNDEGLDDCLDRIRE